MFQNQAGRSWQIKATTYLIASMAGAALSGAGVGWLGQAVAYDARVVAALLLAVVATVIATLELAGRRLAVLQCDRETPQSWIHQGAIGWALRNGLALGCGALSRVGFWSWYVVPVSAFLLADPAVGALIYASYGAARGLGAWAYLVAGMSLRARLDFDDLVLWVLSQRNRAQLTGAAHLLGLAVAAVIALA